MRRLISLIQLSAAVLIVAAVLPGCTQSSPVSREEGPVSVKTLTVSVSDEINNMGYVGMVEDNSTVALSFSTIGTIEKILVSEGRNVRKGELLARLDATSAKNLLDAAESSLQQAKDAHRRLKSIYDAGSLPEIQMVDMDTKLQQAQSQYNIAKKNLDDCSLYAPVSGVIGRKLAEAGENTIPGKQVLTIADISSVKIRFSVPEGEISRISKSCKITVRVAAAGDKLYYGTDPEKGVVANAVSHTYPVMVTVNNADRELLPGMVCSVEINAGTDSRTIVIPLAAVRNTSDGGKFVWIEKNGTAGRKSVVTGMARGNGIEIVSGLEEGDRVVTDGFGKISEGDKIISK